MLLYCTGSELAASIFNKIMSTSQTCAAQTPGLIQFPQPMRPTNTYEVDMRPTSSVPLASPSLMPHPTKPVGLENMSWRREHEEDGVTLDGFLAKTADLSVSDKDGAKCVRKGCSRGLRGSMEQLSHKLERFKVRTLELGEVVKEEDKRSMNMEV